MSSPLSSVAHQLDLIKMWLYPAHAMRAPEKIILLEFQAKLSVPNPTKEDIAAFEKWGETNPWLQKIMHDGLVHVGILKRPKPEWDGSHDKKCRYYACGSKNTCLQPIGDKRKNGNVNLKDWKGRLYHLDCFRRLEIGCEDPDGGGLTLESEESSKGNRELTDEELAIIKRQKLFETLPKKNQDQIAAQNKKCYDRRGLEGGKRSEDEEDIDQEMEDAKAQVAQVKERYKQQKQEVIEAERKLLDKKRAAAIQQLNKQKEAQHATVEVFHKPQFHTPGPLVTPNFMLSEHAATKMIQANIPSGMVVTTPTTKPAKSTTSSSSVHRPVVLSMAEAKCIAPGCTSTRSLIICPCHHQFVHGVDCHAVVYKFYKDCTCVANEPRCKRCCT